MTQWPTLTKPPVTEVYADLVFEAEPNVAWSPERAGGLLERMVPGSTPELLPKVDYRVVQGAEGAEIHLNPGFERVRIWSPDRQECIQIGPSRLVVNRVKQEDTPRFHHLEPLLRKHFAPYCEEYRPAGIMSVGLGYVDDVHLPHQVGEVVDLQDYFRFSVALPSSFGSMIGFATTIKWQAADNATASLEFRSGIGYDFKLHWLAGSEIRSSADLDAVWQRLSELHVRIRDCFFEMFTPKGLTLFDPVTG
jgi:uncharacterized protein (TIGR04255 family)